MPNYETHVTAARGEAFMELFADDGASPPGQTPPVEHIEAVRQAGRVEDVQAVVEAHRQGNSPPDVGKP